MPYAICKMLGWFLFITKTSFCNFRLKIEIKFILEFYPFGIILSRIKITRSTDDTMRHTHYSGFPKFNLRTVFTEPSPKKIHKKLTKTQPNPRGELTEKTKIFVKLSKRA